MENEKQEITTTEQLIKQTEKLDIVKEIGIEIVLPKKIHGNTGKKKNYSTEQLLNKSDKMKEAWKKKRN